MSTSRLGTRACDRPGDSGSWPGRGPGESGPPRTISLGRAGGPGAATRTWKVRVTWPCVTADAPRPLRDLARNRQMRGSSSESPERLADGTSGAALALGHEDRRRWYSLVCSSSRRANGLMARPSEARTIKAPPKSARRTSCWTIPAPSRPPPSSNISQRDAPTTTGKAMRRRPRHPRTVSTNHAPTSTANRNLNRTSCNANLPCNLARRGSALIRKCRRGR
jgi:hypothetical protein